MIQLALPVIATYLGFMLMGVVDIICVGRVSAEAIGAVGVGTSMFSWVMIFGVGLLAGLDYLVSFAQGAGRPEDGHRALVQSLIASTLLSVPLTGLLVIVAFHLGLAWRQSRPWRPDARAYLVILASSLWPIIHSMPCRQYLTAMRVAVPPMVILLVANYEALINWLLVFGNSARPCSAREDRPWPPWLRATR